MPEYAEVYCLVRDLRVVVGKTIEDFWAIDSERFPLLSITNFKVIEVCQLGKVIVFSLVSRKNERIYLNLHLGMTGELGWERELVVNLKGVVTFSDGKRLYLRDHRGFGRWYLTSDKCELEGKEVLGAHFLAHVKNLLRGRNIPIYALMLDQDIIPGVGSYLAQEALYATGLHPSKKNLNELEVGLLVKKLRWLIKKAIREGGATMANYRRLDGSKGQFQNYFRVYSRVGERCFGCKLNLIDKIKIYGRTVYYCPTCQPL